MTRIFSIHGEPETLHDMFLEKNCSCEVSMKKGQVLQGTVAYVDFPNMGVVKVEEGKQVIVKTYYRTGDFLFCK